ncbi:MAG: hypothetical protein ACLFRV_05935 [Acidimicrobiales bacterium]
MLRVYLDQNKWIDLARAATGHSEGERFRDALTMAEAAVDAGAVSFPLDIYRYWETSKRGDDRSRTDVALVMHQLSRKHTMALPFGLLAQELDRALQRRFGRPEQVRRQQVFGLGMDHIVKGRVEWPELDLTALPDRGASIPAGLVAELRRDVAEFVEKEMIRAGPADFRAAGFDHAESDHAKRFVDFENGVAAAILEHGLIGDEVDCVMRGTDLTDIRPPLEDALGRIGMTYEQFEAASSVGDLLAFMDDLPTRYVTNVMRSAKHRQTHQKWKPNDFVDVIALPVAAVYCDVVVTEKQWVHHLRHGRVDERYGTSLLSDVADLTSILIDASVL